MPADTSGIEITASDVTLDLNGFTILGSGGLSGFGVRARLAINVAVLNGTIRQMGVTGVALFGEFSRVERVRALSNGFVGIATGLGSTVTGNTAQFNGFDGIGASSGSVVTGNTANRNGRFGILAGSGSTVIGNTAQLNQRHGLGLLAESGYTHNVFSFNVAGSVSGGVSLGQNLCDGVIC